MKWTRHCNASDSPLLSSTLLRVHDTGNALSLRPDTTTSCMFVPLAAGSVYHFASVSG